MKYWCFGIVCFLVLGFCCLANAMGGKPPAKPEEKPKYKLQILKMEVINAPVLSPEAKPKKK